MTHWPFILASYALTVGGMGLLILASWAAMRRAEGAVTTRISTSLDTDGNRGSTSGLGAGRAVSTSLDTGGDRGSTLAPSVSSDVEKRGTLSGSTIS